MNVKGRKLLAGLLAASMIFSVAPVKSFAEESENGQEQTAATEEQTEKSAQTPEEKGTSNENQEKVDLSKLQERIDALPTPEEFEAMADGTTVEDSKLNQAQTDVYMEAQDIAEIMDGLSEDELGELNTKKLEALFAYFNQQTEETANSLDYYSNEYPAPTTDKFATSLSYAVSARIVTDTHGKMGYAYYPGEEPDYGRQGVLIFGHNQGDTTQKWFNSTAADNSGQADRTALKSGLHLYGKFADTTGNIYGNNAGKVIYDMVPFADAKTNTNGFKVGSDVSITNDGQAVKVDITIQNTGNVTYTENNAPIFVMEIPTAFHYKGGKQNEVQDLTMETNGCTGLSFHVKDKTYGGTQSSVFSFDDRVKYWVGGAQNGFCYKTVKKTENKKQVTYYYDYGNMREMVWAGWDHITALLDSKEGNDYNGKPYHNQYYKTTYWSFPNRAFERDDVIGRRSQRTQVAYDDDYAANGRGMYGWQLGALSYIREPFEAGETKTITIYFGIVPDTTDVNDLIKSVQPVTHTHDWQYELAEDHSTLTAYCKNANADEGCTADADHKLTLSLTADSADYTGQPVNAELNGADDFTEKTSATVSNISYEGTNRTEYTASETAPTLPGDYKASVTVTAADGTRYTLEKTFTINVVNQDEPKVAGQNETISGKKDGQINETSEQMEYRKEGETTYTPVTGSSIINLEPGTYYVRYAKQTGKNESEETKVVIGVGRKLTVKLPDSQDGYTISSDQTELDWHGKAKLTYVLKPGYTETEDFAVTAEGAKVTKQADGNYQITDAENDVTVEVTGVADVTPPTAKITMDDKVWDAAKTGLNFDKLLTEAKDVTISAEDVNTGSGLKEVAYLISDKELTQTELAAADWIPITSGGKFTLKTEGHCVIYVRAEDNAGNVTYVNTDGMDTDTVAPVLNGVESGGSYYGDVTFTVTESNPEKTTIDGKEATPDKDGKYIIPADNKEHTIISTDKAGHTTTCTITVYKNYEVTYGADGNTIDTQIVGYGKNAQAPEVPKKTGYDGKWDKDGKNITENTTITAVYTKKQYTISIPDSQIGYTLTTDDRTVKYMEGTTLHFKLADGYSKLDNFAVTATNAKLTDNGDGTYTISEVTDHVQVTVKGVADITPPTAEISIKENKWKSFLNTVTFDRFFKEDIDVNIDAADVNTGSGLDRVSYYVSEKEMTLSEVKALTDTDWKKYTSKVTLTDDRDYIIYAKAVDKAGNITYVSSDGVVLDKTVPAIQGVENEKTYYGDTSFTVTDKHLTGVTVDGKTITLDGNGSYTIVADNKEHKIVATDQAGNVTEYQVGVYKIYTVIFMIDEKEAGRVSVNYGHDVEDKDIPKIPTKIGYDETAPYWDKDGKNITEDTTITAVYTKNDPGIYTDTTPDTNVGGAKIDSDIEALKQAVPFTPEEEYQNEIGVDTNIWLELTDITDKVSEEEKQLAEAKKPAGSVIGYYMDASLFKQIGQNPKESVTQLKQKIRISFKLPKELINTNPDVIRNYKLIHIHDGVAEDVLMALDTATYMASFETDRFSTYAIAYTDTTKPSSIKNDADGNQKNPTSSGEQDANKKAKGNASPETGDASHPMIWLMLMLVSITGMVSVIVCAKKRKRYK